jgi:hypothetical protein
VAPGFVAFATYLCDLPQDAGSERAGRLARLDTRVQTDKILRTLVARPIALDGRERAG